MEWPGLGNGHTIGLQQEMEWMHDQKGDAGDSSIEIPNMLPAFLAQETDADGLDKPLRWRSCSVSLALSFSQEPAVNSAKGRGPDKASMDAWGIRSDEKTSLEYILM